jgi:hypothetical protein
MRLEKASHKAIKYACMNFHYAKSVPVNVFGYSVFNEKNEWCGVVLYGTGANNNLAMQYKLKQGNVIELVRMALNGKQESTSKALSISLKLIKKDLPLVKLIISYADKDQNHNGIIYQATNWYYVGTSMKNSTDSSWIIKNVRYHGRIISDWVKSKGGLNGLTRKEFLQNYYDVNAREYITKGKIKYIYPLEKSLIPLCKSLSKPYPKAQEVNQDKRDASSIEIGGSNPTLALTKQKQKSPV